MFKSFWQGVFVNDWGRVMFALAVMGWFFAACFAFELVTTRPSPIRGTPPIRPAPSPESMPIRPGR